VLYLPTRRAGPAGGPAHFLVLAALLCLHFLRSSSFFFIQTALVLYFARIAPCPPRTLSATCSNKPQFLFGTNILWYAAIFLFLYVTLSVLRNQPFWRALGWKN